MSKPVDPAIFGLTSRTEIVEIKKNHYAIIKNRKSRIIMKDGKQLLDQVEKIRAKQPKAKISIITNAPVCSKTTAFLKEHGIEFIKTV